MDLVARGSLPSCATGGSFQVHERSPGPHAQTVPRPLWMFVGHFAPESSPIANGQPCSAQER